MSAKVRTRTCGGCFGRGMFTPANVRPRCACGQYAGYDAYYAVWRCKACDKRVAATVFCAACQGSGVVRESTPTPLEDWRQSVRLIPEGMRESEVSR